MCTFHAIAAIVLAMSRWDVALFTCAIVYTHCKILEWNEEPQRVVDAIIRTWHVAIAMTGLRYVLFETQPWYVVFVISLAFGYIEARNHGMNNARRFGTREIVGAATDTALVALLTRDETSDCSVFTIALLPLRARLLQYWVFEIGMMLMTQLRPLTAFEIAAMCTWDHTRNAFAQTGQLFM